MFGLEGGLMDAENAVLELEIICDGLDFPEGPVALSDGSVLVVEIGAGCLTQVFPDGRKSCVANLGGSPNGAAVGPDGAVYVCNNGGAKLRRENGCAWVIGQADDYSGGRIERVDLVSGESRILYTECGGHRLKGPNDIVFDQHGGFYFTDLGKTRTRDRDRGGIYYALPDGSRIDEVAFPLHTPNGIGLSPDGATLYVAESETARLWQYPVVAPGQLKIHPYPSPNGGSIVFGAGGYRRFDSLKVEADGRVCVATLEKGGITVIDPATGHAEHVPLPDRMTTNLCFAGPDLRTAFVTLSYTGRLGMLRWPRPGLKLNFADAPTKV
jgi:gluconolactonase